MSFLTLSQEASTVTTPFLRNDGRVDSKMFIEAITEMDITSPMLVTALGERGATVTGGR